MNLPTRHCFDFLPGIDPDFFDDGATSPDDDRSLRRTVDEDGSGDVRFRWNGFIFVSDVFVFIDDHSDLVRKFFLKKSERLFADVFSDEEALVHVRSVATRVHVRSALGRVLDRAREFVDVVAIF